MPKIDIVIINWNAGNLITEAVNSIIACNYPKECLSILIIDNASSDGSADAIPIHPSIKVIKNKKNVGFAAACNQGILLAKGDYFLLLNPDTKLFNDTLTKSVDFMEHHANISILGVKHVDDNGKVLPSCSHFPNLLDFFVLALGLYELFPSLFRSPIIMKDCDYEKERKVDQVIGAYMFMRRNHLLTMKLKMDERFFVYFEDVDLSKCLQEKGGISYYYPGTSIFHKGNGTTDQVKDKRLFYNIRSRLKYCRKHFNFMSYFLVVLLSLFIEPISRIINLTLKGRFYDIKNIYKGYFLVYKYFFFSV